MRNRVRLRCAALLIACLFPTCLCAQDEGVSLGTLARSLRKAKEPAAPTIIDNDNLSRVMDEVENRRLSGSPLFTLDGPSDHFTMSSPDGSCSLSFNANATSLLTVPYVAEDLPQAELAKLDGPAVIDGDTLQVSVYNGSDWNLKEITVGLTLVRQPENAAGFYGMAKLVLAAEDTIAAAEKHPDLTMLFHLNGSAIPFATTIFRTRLAGSIAPDQEWHWAIVQAKGIAPNPLSVTATSTTGW